MKQTAHIAIALLAILAALPGCKQQTVTQPYYNNGTGYYDANGNYYNPNGTTNPYNTGYDTSYGTTYGNSNTYQNYGYSLDGNPISNLPTGTVAGRVVDSLSNLGLSGVTVEVIGVVTTGADNTRKTISTQTEASGNFTLTNVPQGRQLLTFSKSEYTIVAGNRNIVVDVLAGSTVSSPSVSMVPARASSANGFVRAFGNFRLPRGIAINPTGGDIYVVDVIGAGGLFNYERGEVKKLNQEGGLIDQFASDLVSLDLFRLLKSPNGLGVDTGGNVIVADTGHNVLKKYGSNGLFINEIKKDFKQVFDVATLTTGELIVSDPGNSRVAIMDSGMNVRSELGGDAPFKSDSVRGIAVDNSNNIYVVDAAAKAGGVIKKFDEKGQELPLQFGSIGGIEPGQFNNPTDVAVDNRNGDIYVIDTGNNRVQRFSSEGDYLSEFGSFGSDSGAFNAPWGIAIDREGFIYVSDSKNKRVQKFMPGRFGDIY